MITHRNIESNCKRIAKDIVKHCIDVDVLTSGIICVDVSKPIIDDFNNNKKRYEKEINKHIKKKGIEISKGRHGHEDGMLYLVFYIEYDDVDAEVEDW